MEKNIVECFSNDVFITLGNKDERITSRMVNLLSEV